MALLLVRFFSEGVHILPRSATFIDIPVFLFLVAAAATRGRSLRPSRGYYLGGAAFLTIAVVATIANLSRVAPAPVLVFLYGFLAPLGIYFAVYRLWTPGNAYALSRVLVSVAVIQFFVVGVFQLPKFLSDRDPDDISGTFGDNAYQLVFFLLVVTGLVAATTIFERQRVVARFAPVMFVGVAAMIFLAQYRALLITTGVTIVVIAFFLAKARPGKGIVVGTFAIIAFVASFGYVARKFPTLKLRQALTTLQQDPWFFASARIHAIGDVASLYSDTPRFIVTGTGPGTFSSRAWRTFAVVKQTRTSVASPYARTLNGGDSYQTDVAEKYTLQSLRTAPVIQGSRALTSPWSSYTSLLAEVGLLGFVVYVGIYLTALGRSIALLSSAMRRAVSGDSLPALALACVVAFLVLLQLAALENWLEVTRITFLSWALLAVVTREADERRRAGAG